MYWPWRTAYTLTRVYFFIINTRMIFTRAHTHSPSLWAIHYSLHDIRCTKNQEVLSTRIPLSKPRIQAWPHIFRSLFNLTWLHSMGPLIRYVKLWVAHAPGMSGTFSPAADFQGNCWIAIPACITASASCTCRDACRDRLPAVAGKTIPAFPAHAHPQFYVSGKRPIPDPNQFNI